MMDTGAARGIGVAATDAKAGATSEEGNMRGVVMTAAIPAGATDVDTSEIMVTAATPVVVANSMAEVATMEAPVTTEGAEVDSMVADTDNFPIYASI